MTIAEALQACKPKLAAQYEAQVRYTHARMVQDLGPELKGVHNSWAWARLFRNVVRPSCDGVTLDDSKLAAAAEQYADAAVAAWAGKIADKLGPLADVSVGRLDGCSFRIGGRRGSQRVGIEQQAIVKTSPLGKVFNQFPARIYVDGKFTPEAKYKRGN